MATNRPAIAVVPEAVPRLLRAVEEGGGRLAGVRDADAIVWTDPAGAEGLKRALASSPARLLHLHLRERRWRAADVQPRRLAGTTALLVGTGGIGRALARMLAPIEVRVFACNRSGVPMEGAAATHPAASLAEVIGDADWVVLAAPLTPKTDRLMDAAMLALMKSDAWLVNVARGRLVDTGALVDALERGVIGGAALDVTDPEPLPDGHPLWSFGNSIITPHSANPFALALNEFAAMVRRNVARFAAGEPLEGLVDPALGY